MSEYSSGESTEQYQKAKFGAKTQQIPADWEIGQLGDKTYLKGRIGWHGLTEDDHLEQGEYYLVTGTDFESGQVQWDRCKYVNKDWYEKDENIQLEENDILVTKDGSIGKVAFVDSLPGEATLNNGMFVLRPLNDEYAPIFFYYILKSSYFEDFIESITAGSTISHLYQKDFVNFRFPLPTPAEQRRIAEILSTVDELIHLTDAIIEETERLKRGLMQDLLTRGIGHESFKRVSLGPVELKIPVEWTDCFLEDIADIKRGASPRPIGDSKFFGGDVGWIRISDINNSFKYITNSSEYLSDLGVSKSVRVHPGEVLLSISASVGECVIVDFDACIHDGIVTLRNLSDNYNNEFLYYYLLFSKTRFISKGQTGTQSNINSNLVRGIEILVPPLPEQRRIAEILSTVDDIIQKEHQTKTELEALKRGLMQDLLTGKVRVPVET